MLGAIVGDIAGSVYEFHPVKEDWADLTLFSTASRFTDDTVMTLAVADALHCAKNHDTLYDMVTLKMREYDKKWPKAGYGCKFVKWLMSDKMGPYNSFGNGSAMRVSGVGWYATSLDETEKLAALSAAPTYNHPEGIKGAQAVAGAIYLARTGKSRNSIRDYVASRYEYNMNRTLDEIRRTYRYDITCQGSVPESIIAFLESENFEQAIRKAILLRGDADTQGAIAGSLAEAFYGGVPDHLAKPALMILDESLRDSYLKCWNWLVEKKGKDDAL